MLAINRQIPSWLGKLSRRYATPHVAIAICGADRDRRSSSRPTSSCSAGSSPSARRWRSRSPTSRSSGCGSPSPDRERPFRIPLRRPLSRGAGCRCRRCSRRCSPASPSSACSSTTTPPAGSAAAGWLFGLVSYVVYRKVVEGTTLTKRVSVPERGADQGRCPRSSTGNILVPVFGTKLDDDIVGTAGRLADAAERAGRATPPRLEVVYVIEVPLTRAARRAAAAGARGGGAARRWSAPARWARSTRTSRSAPTVVRARDVGAGIVEAARDARRRGDRDGRRAADPDPRRRVLGGIGGARPAEIGAGDRVRAEEGALPGAADRARRRRPAEPEPRARRR